MLRPALRRIGIGLRRELGTRCVVIGAAAIFAAGCSAARRDGPVHENPPPVEVGVSSWYGAAFAGRPTASGEIFDPARLTAAHRTLPLGSIVRVTNLDNGRSIVVRVNDRGPFVRGRVLDVSEAAARSLGFRTRGVARVAIEWPRVEEPVTAGARFWLQLGAFRDAAAARKLARRAAPHAETVALHRGSDYLRVHAGPYRGRDGAEAARSRLREAGFAPIVVVLDGSRLTAVE